MKDTNYLYNLTSYIKKNLGKGYTKDSLKIALTNQGYTRISIDAAFKLVEEDMASRAPKLEMMPAIVHEITPEEPKKSFWQKLFGF